MNPRTWAAAVAVAVLLGTTATACGGDDEPADTARVDSGQPDRSSSTPPPTTGSDDAGADDSGDADDVGETVGASTDRTLQEQVLDVSVRNDSGISLAVSRIGPEGADVVVDAVVVNGARDAATFHMGNWASDRLRLVDDAGEEYNLVEVEEDQAIELAPGETLDATFAFRGPLHGEPERVYLVTNVPTDEVEGFDAETATDSTIYPKFVVPIDLEWS
jgi:hypothetical protein